MFDGLIAKYRKFETLNDNPQIETGSFAENAGFLDCEDTYQDQRNQVLESIFKSAPHLRGMIKTS
jgi:hypothetical protein